MQAGEEAWAADLAGELEGSGASDESLLGHRLLAELAVDQGRLDEARWHYESFLEAASSDDRWAVDSQYLEVLRDLGESDEVVDQLERRIEELGRQGWWQSKEAYMAEQLEYLDLHPLALPYRERLLAKAPENPGHRVAMGELLRELERWDEAEGHFGRASQLAPDDVYIAQSVAEFYVERGQGDKALESLAPFADQSDLPDGLLLAQSRAFREVGQLEEAETMLGELLAERADFYEARLEIARLYDETGDTRASPLSLRRVRQLDREVHRRGRQLRVLLRSHRTTRRDHPDALREAAGLRAGRTPPELTAAATHPCRHGGRPLRPGSPSVASS